MENLSYGWECLKDIVEKEEGEKEAKAQQQEEDALAAAKEQQQDYDEQYDKFAKIKLVYEGKRFKEFRMSGNLNRSNTKMIINNITPLIQMRTKVFYSFKSVINRGTGEIVDNSKILTSPPSMFTTLEQIQAYIEECEQKRLDLENSKV